MTKKKSTNYKLLHILLPFLKPHVWTIIFIFLILPLSSFTYSVQPLILQKAIDGPLKDLNLDSLWIYIVLLLAAVVVNFLVQVLQFWFVNLIGQNLVADIRERLFIHIESLSMSYFDKSPVGRTVSRLTSDIEQLAESFSGGLILILLDVFNIIGILAFMFYLNLQMSLIVSLFLIPVYLLSRYYQKMFRQANLEARKELSKLNSFLQQNVIGISVVQVLNSVEKSIKSFAANNEKYFKANDESIKADAQLSALTEFISLLAIASMMLLAAFILKNNSQTVLSIGIILAFLQYTQSLFEPIRNLTDRFTVLQSAFTALERVEEVIELEPEIKDIAEPKQINDESEYIIEFNNVSFRYSEDSDWILKDFNLKIKTGEKLAVVGRTGSGKSTLIKLLTRLYDIEKGEILFKGINIKDLKQSELRKRVAVIHQDSYIFAGDLESNIKLGRDEEILHMDFVEPLLSLTNLKKENSLSERAANISSGETQIINFARALITKPEFLVLDEATAKVDHNTEKKIQDRLFEFLESRTAIIIAHRLETIKNCQQIVYVDDGRVVEKGSHQELIQLSGMYKNLYEKFA